MTNLLLPSSHALYKEFASAVRVAKVEVMSSISSIIEFWTLLNPAKTFTATSPVLAVNTGVIAGFSTPRLWRLSIL